MSIKAGLVNCNKIMGVVRRVIKILRTPNCREYLKALDLAIPTLDMPTRWSSIYRMITCFLKLKGAINDMSKKKKYNIPKVSDQKWNQVGELHKILELAHIVSQKLQADGLTAGECLHQWNRLIFEFDKPHTTMVGQLMLQDMRLRQRTLMVPMFMAACLVDPFHSFELSDERHIEAATVYIVKLARQIRDYDNPNSSIPLEDLEPLEQDLEDVLGEEIDLEDYQAVMRRRRASGAPAAQVETPVKLLNLLNVSNVYLNRKSGIKG